MIVPGGVDRGGERKVIPALLWLIQRLAREHDVHVFALYQEAHASQYHLHGATVHAIGQGWTHARAIRAVVREHVRCPFSLLHAFWATPPGVIAVTAGRLLRRPVVLHLGGGELARLPEIAYGGRRSLRGRLALSLALRGAVVVTAATDGMRHAAAQLGVPVERLPLGVDLGIWKAGPPRPRDVNRPAQLVHVGSLNLVKDQGTLLRAAAGIARARQAFHLDIVGEDVLSGQAQRLAAALNVAHCVSFHGFLTQRELVPLVQAADLFMLSSRHEAGPVAVLEAAVAGVPTVGTDVGHVRDWAPQAAVAVPVGDYEALARETLALLRDDGHRLRVANAAQSLAVKEDADWTAERLLALYRQAVLKQGPGAKHVES